MWTLERGDLLSYTQHNVIQLLDTPEIKTGCMHILYMYTHTFTQARECIYVHMHSLKSAES